MCYYASTKVQFKLMGMSLVLQVIWSLSKMTHQIKSQGISNIIKIHPKGGINFFHGNPNQMVVLVYLKKKSQSCFLCRVLLSRCGVVPSHASWVSKVEAGVLQARAASPSGRATAS